MAGVLEIAEAVRSGRRSAREVLDEALERIEALDGRLGAFVALDPERSRRQAEGVDRLVEAGDDPGPLAGVPLGVKDLEHAEGFRTTFGDPAYRDDEPARSDSLEVARLRAAGAVVVGKTNTPAHGVRAETDNVLFGPTRNPWAPDRTPGGSSGGSAAAIAAGLVPLATGSDGGGSIRIPSAVCGLSGLKPTNGVVPGGDDEAPAWWHYSTRGPMARTFAEVAVALDVVRGFTPRDLLSVDVHGSFVDAAGTERLDGVRVAWSPTVASYELDPRVLAQTSRALHALESLGATIDEIGDVFDDEPAVAWGPRAAFGTRVRFEERGGNWEERFDPPSRVMAEVTELLTGTHIVEGENLAHRINLQLADVLSHHELLVCPATLTVPPRVGEESPYGPGWAANVTMPFNLTRSPVAVTPVGFVDDEGDELPVAVQLVGPRLTDVQVLAAGAALEGTLGLVGRRPPLHAD